MSRGMGTWTYRFGNDVESVRDFTLTMRTDFDAIDFPPQTLLPVAEQRFVRAGVSTGAMGRS